MLKMSPLFAGGEPFPNYFQLLTVEKVWFHEQLFCLMIVLLFSGIDPFTEYRECHYLGYELELSLDVLTRLANNGWQLIKIKLIIDSSLISLPVELFYNESLAESLKQLQEEWEEVLGQ